MQGLLLAATILAHSWFPPYCCNENDCRKVDCAEITFGTERTGNFVYYRGLKGIAWAVYTSPDSSCHLCSYNTVIRCAFLPERLS